MSFPAPTTPAAAACLLCSAPTAAAATLAPLPLVRCDACGFTFRPALADTGTTKEIYEGGAYEDRDFAAGYADPSTIEERRQNARSRLAFLTAHVPGRGRLLDVGAAGGAFVLEARNAGFDAVGVEPAPAFARHAREVLGVDVRDGRVEDVAPDSAEVITLWHVLEHVPDPVGALRHLAIALTADGRLVLEVPNLASAAAAMHGTAWVHLDVETHVSHFTPQTLRAALDAAGLRPLVELSVAHDAYLTAAERRAPRNLAARVKLAVQARRDGRGRDPWRHEFLRVVAERER